MKLRLKREILILKSLFEVFDLSKTKGKIVTIIERESPTAEPELYYTISWDVHESL